MSINERWQQVDRVFQAAVELEPEKRSAFLNEACHGDEQLRQKIEPNPAMPKYLKTEPWVGYRFEPGRSEALEDSLEPISSCMDQK